MSQPILGPAPASAYSAGTVRDALQTWAREQRTLAEALGLSLEDWMTALDAASQNRAGVTAAVIGASMARRSKMPDLSRVKGPSLAAVARRLIDPEPPRTRHPVLAEAIRRADRFAPPSDGDGKKRLQRRAAARPDRAAPSDAPSDHRPTADAPGQKE